MTKPQAKFLPRGSVETSRLAARLGLEQPPLSTKLFSDQGVTVSGWGVNVASLQENP